MSLTDNCPACGYRSDEPAREWTVRIQHKYLGLNQVKSNVRGVSGRAYKKERRFYTSALARKRVPKAKGWRQILVRRVYGKGKRGWVGIRAYDYDNYVGGGKPLVDALKAQGWILEDDETHANISHMQQQRSPDGKDWVEITVQEFEYE